MTDNELWYDRPARTWTEALPLGNGTLGAMVWGGVDEEVVSLNEETLWSGYPDRWFNDGALAALAESRELLLQGRRREAQTLVETKMAGRWTQAYLPLGRLRVACDPGSSAGGATGSYRRSLDLRTATSLVKASSSDGSWTREAFVSAPARVLVYQFRSARPRDWTVSLESDLRGAPHAEVDGLTWSGVAPRFVTPSYLGPHDPEYGTTPETSGMRYTMRYRLEADGEIEYRPEVTVVKGCRELVVILAAATSYVDRVTHPFVNGADETARVGESLRLTQGRSYNDLRQEHIEDHQKLYFRAGLSLPGAPQGSPDLPTDARMFRLGQGQPDPGLAALAFHYGRYLLIASSRPGGQPAPLQGLWNQDLQAPWSGNYTTNINTEMNYWLAEVTNLADCHMPLLSFITDVALAGRAVATRHYGARGWTAHHNLDVWAHPIPAGDNGGWFPGSACHLFWPLGGAWLSHHLWEHWAFGQDRRFLERVAWPVLREATRFCLDWLCEGPDGTLTTLPSTSPENRYLASGESFSIDIGTTSDLAAIRELLGQTLEASRILSVEPELVAEILAALARLPGYRATATGALAEWSQDFEAEEPGHRHFSHLYGLFPGTQIGEGTPRWSMAVAQSLKERLDHGGGGTGWSLAWLICLQARLGDGNAAEASIRRWLASSVFLNLFDLHPTQEGEPGVFQIDGNFGVTAGIAELFVQSHESVVHLLPALPEAWPQGRVWGLRVRGGAEVSLEWAEGALVRAEVRATQTHQWPLRLGDHRLVVSLSAGESIVLGANLSTRS